MPSSRSPRLLPSLLAAVTLATPALGAAPETPETTRPYLFETVDDVVVRYNRLDVTGVLRGETVPRSFTFSYYAGTTSGDSINLASRCDRLALLAMARPGVFLLEMVHNGSNLSSPSSCRLIRRAALPVP
ncbi:hypothetical protein LY474_38125 [Myxococcus stipitatus]|uniref:hypothetical protein n=1 Tax=Myxococcus stipitatus TaxID=83455 RepID=UPI001F31E6AB|nr:hypothetical protein [Myxococcus stipitatus]MCE9673638.1 hypothetical protein [Myxococcus stipitatus]